MNDRSTKLAVIYMDLEKLYHSLTASDVARVVKEEYIDTKELGLHLAVTMQRRAL